MSDLTAIIRAVAPALARCELTFLAREPIDFAQAARQHRSYCAALGEAGIRVLVLPPDERLPDAVFVEDAAVVLDEVAVITRPGSAARRMELPPIDDALSKVRPVLRMAAPATLDGGDVLRIGRKLFVGSSVRTNRAGFEQFTAIVEPFGYEPVQVRVHGCLHLKTAVTALSEDAVLMNPRWLDPGPFSGFHQIEVPEDEPFAANTLAVGDRLLVSARWPRTRDLLDRGGFAPCPLDISEFEKAEAGLTCLSLIFARQPAAGPAGPT